MGLALGRNLVARRVSAQDNIERDCFRDGLCNELRSCRGIYSAHKSIRPGLVLRPGLVPQPGRRRVIDDAKGCWKALEELARLSAESPATREQHVERSKTGATE